MVTYTPMELYAMSKNVLRAPEDEAVLAARNGPKIQEIMEKYHVPVESAIFSFLADAKLVQSFGPIKTDNQRSGGWRQFFGIRQ